MNKKFFFILSLLVFVVSFYFSYSFFAGGAIGGFSSIFSKGTQNYKPPSQAEVPTIDEKAPKTEACPINGEKLTRAHRTIWEKRRPLLVMIENHLEARPQSGLTSADVVYEAVAEGGITRFLVVFYCKDAEGFVGPVRSARMYFLSMAQSYGDHPLYVHVGGANTPGPANALGEIKDLGWYGYNDMNQFAIPFPYFWRDYDRLPTKMTEHTMYSSTKKLWEFAKTKRELTNVNKDGEEWNANFLPWKFSEDSKTSDPVNKISFGFWQGKNDYGVSWEYDSNENSFKRINAGVAHKDKNNNKQITAKNVVIAFMKESPARDGYPDGHLLYKTTGGGSSIFFKDGKAYEGSWKRKDEESLIRFYDEADEEIAFNRGQTWIEIVPEGNKVEY